MLKGNRIWLWTALALLLFIGIGFLLSGEQPKTYNKFLSTSPSPTGMKAFYTYMQDEQADIDRWYGQPSKLPKASHKQGLIMVGPYFRYQEEEEQRYKGWMEQGNTILLMKQDPVGYFGTKIEYTEPSTEASKLKGKNGETYEAHVPGNIRLRLQNGDEELLSDDQGTVALKRSFGKGELIISLQPEWVTNGAILNQDHMELSLFLVNQTNASSLLVDEYGHGQDNLPTYLTVYPQELLVFMLQLAILTILAIWIRGKRFGPVYLPREAEVRFGDERLRALAAWYMRSDFFNESLSIQEQYVRYAVSERWGVSIKHSWKEIFEVIQSRLTEDQVTKWKEWVPQLQHVRQNERWSKKEYVTWSQKLDHIRKEVQEG